MTLKYPIVIPDDLYLNDDAGTEDFPIDVDELYREDPEDFDLSCFMGDVQDGPPIIDKYLCYFYHVPEWDPLYCDETLDDLDEQFENFSRNYQ